MRIVIAGQTYYPGNNGQAIFTIHLAEGLARAGHAVHMLVPNDRLRCEHSLINGVRVHRVRGLNFGWLHPEANIGVLPYWQVRGLLRSIRPHVVHIQDHYFLARDVVLAARGLGIPVLGTNHFLPENVLHYLSPIPLPRQAKIDVLWRLMHWTYNSLAEVTTPTDTAARILCATGLRPPVSAVSCGVDTNVFSPPPAGFQREEVRRSFGLDSRKVVILYVGRLDREKRVDLLLRALAELPEEQAGAVQLAVAGQGAAKGELVHLAHALGVAERARFLGYIPGERLPDLYRAADVFAMPSPEELQSIATLEAMATGLPVIAANVRALPELVEHGLNGCLFPAGSAQGAASAVVGLLARRAGWPALGRESRRRALAHSIDNTIRAYEEIYRRLSESRLPASRMVAAHARAYALYPASRGRGKRG